VDTLKLARTNFNFNSNRLDYLGKVLGVGGKEETGGFSLWADVMNGSKQALKDMIKYCKRDVVLLEDVYNKIAPHVASFTVHGGVLKGGNRASCPNPGCGSSDVQRRGTRVTAAGVEQQKLTCMDCRHSFSMPLSMANKIYGGTK